MSVAFPPTTEFLMTMIWLVLEELQTVKLMRKPSPEQLLKLHEDEGMLIIAMQKMPVEPEFIEQRDEAIVGFMYERKRTQARYEKLYGSLPAGKAD